LVIEDSISGAKAAVAAGMKVIGLAAGSHIVEGHSNRLLEVGVQAVAKNASELLTLINEALHN